MDLYQLLAIFLCYTLVLSNELPSNSSDQSLLLKPTTALDETGHKENKRYEIVKLDFERVTAPYIISLWIAIVGLAKIGFNVTPKLSSICPESVVLMILGVIIGLTFFYGGYPTYQPLTPNLFFIYMLPPIVMDAGYNMPNRLFFDNLSSILLYAVIGTVWNALTIGIALYWVGKLGLFGVELPLLDTLLFSSIVSAVDPVAVLAVFEEIHVNEVLYILVFGESLLNDGVTVVLYHMFEGYSEMGADNILTIDYIAGFASFFVISLGGIIVGIIWGFLSAFVSRFTHHVKIIEPIFVFVMSYLAYLTAETFHLSGILALTFCGITMKNYVEDNVTETSNMTLKYAMKMLSNASESTIFLFLGMCTINDSHDWNTFFVFFTIVFCLIFRSLGVAIFTAFANRFRLHKLSGIEQFIMAYGGLRGAVAFALVMVIDEHLIPTKKMMVTTVIALVYFTVFLQGMTVGPLVKILNVPRAKKYELTMNERIHTRLMDHCMAGIEDISGMMMGNYKLRDKFRHFNNNYLKHWFLRDCHEKGFSSRKIIETVSRLELQDAINLVKEQNLSTLYLNNNKLSASKSFSSIIRTFTQANLANLESPPPQHDSQNSPSQLPLDNDDGKVYFNFDVGNIEYNPSHKDMHAAEMHHILSDSMFKPIKRYRKYSKADISPETPENHPPFRHQARLEIRHLLSQNKQRKKYKKAKNNYNLWYNTTSFDGKPVDKGDPSYQSFMNQTQENLDTEEGITFIAKRSDSNPAITATESVLPWRRCSVVEDSLNKCGGPMKQEFPPWIANKDYVLDYASPSNTMLRSIDESSESKRIPVYDIFTIEEDKSKSDGERSQTSKEEINMAFIDDENCSNVKSK